jgi:Skp family chaperone for outer membrane proteins
MKVIKIAALLGMVVTTSAFAQANTTAADASASVTASQTGAWGPPQGEANLSKTRAQVYAELVQAEKDGQLEYLNSTIYRNP